MMTSPNDAIKVLLRVVQQLQRNQAQSDAAIILLLRKEVFTVAELEQTIARTLATRDVILQLKRLEDELNEGDG